MCAQRLKANKHSQTDVIFGLFFIVKCNDNIHAKQQNYILDHGKLNRHAVLLGNVFAHCFILYAALEF